MTCPTCSPSPKNTIWDGITLAFNLKHLLPSLQPPTTTNKQSPIRDMCWYVKNQQCFINKDVWKIICTVITNKSHPLKYKDSEQSGTETEDGEAVLIRNLDNSQSIGGFGKHVEMVAMAVDKLWDVDHGIVDIFTKWYGPEALVCNAVVPIVYKQLFLQVGVACAASLTPWLIAWS
jgi:hypothetical protein